MSFLVLNIILIFFLLGFSFHVDKFFEKRNDAFINSILILIVATILQVIVLLMPYYENIKFWLLLGMLQLIMRSMFVIFISFYCMQFPLFKKRPVVFFFKIILIICTVFIIFSKTTGIIVSENTGVLYSSQSISENLSFTWLQAYDFILYYGLPCLAILVSLVNPYNTRTKLDRQKMLINISGLVIFAGLIFFFTVASQFAPMFNSLYSFPCAVLLLILYKAVTVNILYDLKYILQQVFQVILVYVVPGIVGGLAVAACLPLRDSSLVLFILSLIAVVVLLLAFSHVMVKFFSRRSNTFNSSYEKQLENDLAELDYSAGPEEVTAKLNAIFSNNIGTTGIHIMMNYGVDFETVYCSSDFAVHIPADNPVFDSLLNINRTIVFKNQLDTQHVLYNIKDRMRKIFEDTHSEVCILLVEGRRLLGLILLNQKRLGNVYTTYDYSVFTKLYSYFFLIGYYMHSVANESVVGTVNREIKMSDQIIHSIQENMDFIKNPKVDVGYLMVPAHNIGGEFIDFIRLTDERHIFVLGAMNGKGITASMSMVILKSIIRTFLSETKDFKELIQKVNAFIRFNLPKGTFFSGVFALMDFKENVMYYINCGVPALLLYTQAYNNVIEIQGEGRVLGFAKNIEKLVKVKKIKLNPGDIVFACTEGLIDSLSLRGEMFGKDRIQKSIMENLTYASDKLAQFTYQNLLAFTSKELEADITVLVLKYLSR